MHEKRIVLRPEKHAQGKHLWVVSDYQQLTRTLAANRSVLAGGWYGGELIDKVAEFRVYFLEGRVTTVAQKHPENPNAVAWNVAQGGEFSVLKWDSWPLQAIEAGKKAIDLTDLDFGGVDIMIERDTDRAYVIEINSAPSLPLHEDGGTSYRQKCMAKGFRYIQKYGKGAVPPIEQYENWRDVIHPAIWRPKKDRDSFDDNPFEYDNDVTGKIIFYRKKKLGLGSVRGMSWLLNNKPDAPMKRKMGGYVGEVSGYVRNDFLDRMPNVYENDWLVRWGCTARTERIPLANQLNPSRAITEVGMKRQFRMKCMREAPDIVPISFDTIEGAIAFFND